jgi:radical SAM protein with 4Fe4S-binding SPASM domain
MVQERHSVTTYSELRQAPRIDLAEAAPLRSPLTIYVEPTNLCNFRCTFCPHSFKDFSARAGYHQLMTMELFIKVLKDIWHLGGVKSLKLYFDGEPLIHPEIGMMEKMATSSGVAERVELTTNCSLLTAARCQELIDAEVDYVQCSVYSVDTVKHGRIIGNHNFTPAHIRDNVKMLRWMRDSQQKTKPFVYAKLLGRDEWDAFQKYYEGIADEIGLDDFHSWQSDLLPVQSLVKKACPYPFYTLNVRANGEVVPCCVAWGRELIVGDVNHESLADIWRGEKLATIHRTHLAGVRSTLGACQNCDTFVSGSDNIDSLSVEEYGRRLQAR